MRTRHLAPVTTETRFVRVTGVARGGFIEFQFAIGDPTLYLEMILPPTAFEEFCRMHDAVHLDAEQGRRVDADRAKWREGRSADGAGEAGAEAAGAEDVETPSRSSEA